MSTPDECSVSWQTLLLFPKLSCSHTLAGSSLNSLYGLHPASSKHPLRILVFPRCASSFRGSQPLHSRWVLLVPTPLLHPSPPLHWNACTKGTATSRFPGLLDIFLAVLYSASQQPWAIRACHPEALPFQVSKIRHPLVFPGLSALSSVDIFFPKKL